MDADERLHILVCLKSVLDPEAVNSYALWGKLEVDEGGRALRMPEIRRIMNGYDEQAVEAALQLREAGANCRITALTVGDEDSVPVVRRAIAMGVDDSIHVADARVAEADSFRTAQLIARVVSSVPRPSLVLCGRQGSDYDQGSMPAALAEYLDMAFVSAAASLELTDGGLRASRTTTFGSETVVAPLPAVVTISNEFGTPRYPTSRGMMLSRQAVPLRFDASLLEDGIRHPIVLEKLHVAEIKGECEFISGVDPRAKAANLLERLRAEGMLS